MARRGGSDPDNDHLIFEALADRNRRQILELLAVGDQPAGAIVAALQAQRDISQPAVSQHLRVLREARLVDVRAEGTQRIYVLDRARCLAAAAWLAHLADPLAPYTQPLDALATEVARGRRSALEGSSPMATPTRRRLA